MRIGAAKPLVDVLEKEWDAQLIGTPSRPGLARQLGWDGYHTLRSKGSPAGYPDWTLVRERILWIETKREQGRLMLGQQEWIRKLLAAGGEVYVVRPHDLEDIAKVLSVRLPPGDIVTTEHNREALLAKVRLFDALYLELDGLKR